MDEIHKRKLLYRANYRGFKEADILLGGYLKTHIDDMSDEALLAFEHLMSAHDHDIYDWITGKQDVPPGYDLDLIQALRDFRPDF